MKKLLYLAAGAALVAMGISAREFPFSQYSSSYSPAQKVRKAAEAIIDNYVDTVDEEKLAEDAINAMLGGLDPHSSYTNAEETRELNEPLAGNFSGIGITYNMNKDTLYVIQTVSGGPSERVGILAGDRIIAVNDSSIAGVNMKTKDIMKRLRGPKGTKVDLRVLRMAGGSTDTIEFRVTRDDIPIYSVDASFMVDSKTGYIRINRFAAETRNEFEKAVNDLRKQGMKNLIIDLVDNGGGYLNAAIQLLGELMEPGNLAVYTEGRNSPRYDAYTKPEGKRPLFQNGRLVVMVNQYSASASEITAGAIQDWDRGVIVGRRTFGKGLVQRPVRFPDGSEMRLTVAHYYTPSGRDIQKPYTKGESKKYREDISDRLESGELMHADSIKYADSLRMETITAGRVIYGGGGISPDVFVPLDTTRITKYYRDLSAKGVLNQYCIQYVDHNRDTLKKRYKNDDEFVKHFAVSDSMLQELYDMATKEGVEFNADQAAQSREVFEMNIKGLIGRDIFDQATFYKVYNLYDPIFKEALRIINSPEYNRLLQSPT